MKLTSRTHMLAGWCRLSLACALVAACAAAESKPASDAVVLTNENGMEVHILPTGASLQRLYVPDANGELVDVLLGYDEEEVYKVRRGNSQDGAASTASGAAAAASQRLQAL